MRVRSRTTRASRSTLQNPVIYKNFVMFLAKNNPTIEIDPEIIDTSLEWDEALAQLQRHYPDLKTAPSDELPEIRELRGFLDEYGIENKHVQNLIIADDRLYSESELANIGYTLNARSPHAVKIDLELKAPTTRDVRAWAKHPNRLDIRGLDNPGAKGR